MKRAYVTTIKESFRMKSPGEILRRAREERGWSIDEASRITCISRSHIQHLENDAFEEFQDVFARGFIRNYARELGCDSFSVVRSFEQFRSDSEVSEASSNPVKSFTVKKKKDVSYLRIGLILGLLIATVLGVGLMTLSNATAEDPTSFADEKATDSETVENVRKTRWLLEQPENDPERIRR